MKLANKPNHQSGFTLLEMLVAIFIFTIVLVVATSAIINIINVNKKARSMQTVMSNINLAIEDLSRDIRFGSNYRCDDSVDLYASGSCPTSGSPIISLTKGSQRIIYELSNSSGQGQLIKTAYDPVNGAATNDLTSSEVDINRLEFYVVGTDGANPHPRVLILLGGNIHLPGNEPTTFSIQTTVAQRNL